MQRLLAALSDLQPPERWREVTPEEELEAHRRHWALSQDRRTAEAEAMRRWPEKLDMGRWDGITISAERALLAQRRAFAMGAQFQDQAMAAKLTAGDASDGYHTHNELYDYRMLYNAHAAHGWLADGFHVVKSWYHSDGEPCFEGGWFVVVAELSTGQVTNHYQAEHWGLFNIPEELPPAYDGHSPAEAAQRLRDALGGGN